jgi:integrase
MPLIRRHYTSVDPISGQKVRKRAPKWYGQFVDANGQRQRVPLCKNKAAASQMLNAIERKEALKRAGVIDPFEDHRKRPLAEHLNDWKAVLEARENTADYVALKIARAQSIIEACGFTFIADLSASKVESCLAAFRRDNARFSTQTSNHYLGAIKQLTRWLQKDRRCADNPLSHLEGGNVDLDRRHVRRELLDDEIARLLHAARTGRIVRKLKGPDREPLYLVAMYTGLRASELASLTPESFVMNLQTPTVTVQAGYSKHRREDVLPLHDDLVRHLRPWLASKPAGRRVWPGKWAEHKSAGDLIKADLKAARKSWIAEAVADADELRRRKASAFLKYANDAGEVADFHALRHTFISRLVRSGASPKEAQALARHSTIVLTMDRYSHIAPKETAAAVKMMPAIPSLGSFSLAPPLAPASDEVQGNLMKIDQTSIKSDSVVESPKTQQIPRFQRRERDSNPRTPFGVSGFQDRCNQPLCHPSERVRRHFTKTRRGRKR